MCNSLKIIFSRNKLDHIVLAHGCIFSRQRVKVVEMDYQVTFIDNMKRVVYAYNTDVQVSACTVLWNSC